MKRFAIGFLLVVAIAPAAHAARAAAVGPGQVITLPGIERSALRGVPRVQPPTYRLGPVRATLAGERRPMPFGRRATTALADDPAAARSDAYAGASLALAFGAPGDIVLDGGRITLADPLEELARGDGRAHFWTASAGVVVRF